MAVNMLSSEVTNLKKKLSEAERALVESWTKSPEDKPDTKPADTGEFAATGFRYYSWRNPPLENTHNSRDPIYLTDRLVREFSG